MPAYSPAARYCSRILALSLLAAGLVHATPTEYDNLPDFVAALGPNSAVETFDGLPAFAMLDSEKTFTPGIFSFSAAATLNLFSSTVGSDIVLSTNTAQDPITLTMLSGNVYAIGGYFWNTDDDFSTVVDTITLELNDGTRKELQAGGPDAFYGFVSDVPILSLTITPAVNLFATIDDIYLADSPVADTPEPGTVFAAVAGLAAIAFIRRRRLARP